MSRSFSVPAMRRPLVECEKALNRVCQRYQLFTPTNWQLLSVASGFLFVTILFLALIACGFIPPLPPSWGADKVYSHYHGHRKGIQAGAALILISSGLCLPYGAVISKQLRMIRDVDPILCDLSLVACGVGSVSFMMSSTFLGLATFRDYGPELTLLLSDLFWFTIVMQWPPFWIQCWTITWAILSDRSSNPAFPRSLAILNFIAPLALSSATAIHLYHRGPYAWNGALSFWFAFVLFFAQIELDLITIGRNVLEHRRLEFNERTI